MCNNESAVLRCPGATYGRILYKVLVLIHIHLAVLKTAVGSSGRFSARARTSESLSHQLSHARSRVYRERTGNVSLTAIGLRVHYRAKASSSQVGQNTQHGHTTDAKFEHLRA